MTLAPETIVAVLDFFGVFTSAVAATVLAKRQQLDIFGAVMIAFVASIGGGTTRDLLLNRHPLFWLKDLNYAWTITLTSLFTQVFYHQFERLDKPFRWFDALALAVNLRHVIARGGLQDFTGIARIVGARISRTVVITAAAASGEQGDGCRKKQGLGFQFHTIISVMCWDSGYAFMAAAFIVAFLLQRRGFLCPASLGSFSRAYRPLLRDSAWHVHRPVAGGGQDFGTDDAAQDVQR